jgi:DNA-binding MarR family transcriptional regulator
MRELAEHFSCDASYITSLVDGLEQQGLAERRPCPTDRRVKTVVLTPAGKRTQAELFELMWEPPKSFNVLTAAEQRQLRDLLRKVAEADETLQAARRSEGLHAAPAAG